MKKLLLITSFIALTLFCKAQAPNWLWEETGTGGGYGYCSGMAFGPLDTIYLAGRTGSAITIGGQTYNTGGNTYPYIAKLDTNYPANSNNAYWVNAGLTSGFDYPYGICTDKEGHLYQTGDMNSGETVFIVKFNNNGTVEYNYNTNVSNGAGTGEVVDNSENVYVTGNFSGGSVQFGGTPALSYGGSAWAGFLTKYDSTLVPIWSTSFSATDGGNSNYVTGKSVAKDLEGNIYVVGSYQGTCTFYSANGNSTTATAPPYGNYGSGSDGNLFVAKYDSSGVVQWAISVADAGLNWNSWGDRNHIAVDSCGNIYVAGYFNNSTNFGQFAVTTKGGNNMYVAKFNTKSMVWEWVNTAGGSGPSEVNDIALDKTSNVYVVGSFTSPSVFNDTTLSNGNFFLAKYSNSNGALQWVQAAEIQGQSAVMDGVAVDGQNYCYVVGTYSGSNSYLGSVNLPNAPGGSVFIAKMDTVPPREIIPTLDTIYCSKGTISFSIIGTFNQGNIFTAQLSDSSGSFTNPINIGYDTTTVGGAINFIIPDTVPNGNTYLIRIISSTPPTSSYANGCGAYYVKGVYPNDFYVTIGRGAGLNVTLTPSNNVALCGNNPVTLTASGGSAGDTYLWNTGATDSSITVNPSVDTTYTVQIIGGCGFADTAFHVNVNADTVTIQPQFPTLCNGSTIFLTVPPSGTNYSWTPSLGLNQATGDSVVASPTATVTYTVTGTNSSGCNVTDSDIITVTSPLTAPTMKQNGDTIISSYSQNNTWTLNDSTVAGYTDSSIIIKKSGWVQVTETNAVNGCSATSDSVYFNVAGIAQLAIPANAFSIYPNPTNGTVNVTIKVAANELSGLSLQITDVLGRILYTQQALNYANTIDVSPLASGVYFVSILNAKGRTVLPLIKQN